MGCVIDRLLKYNADFREYIDVDTNTDVKDFDRFPVFLSTSVCQMKACLGEFYVTPVFKDKICVLTVITY